MDFKKLVNKIVLLSILFLALSFVIIFIFDLKNYIKPLILGWLISFANAFAGSFIINRTLKEKGKGFINKVLLSLVVRLFSVVGLIFIVIYFLKIDKIALAVVFFFFYAVFLILEINFLSANNKK